MSSYSVIGSRLGRSELPFPPTIASARLDAKKEPLIERFEPGQTISWEGDESRYIFQLVSGATRHCRMLFDGRRVIVGFGHPGDLFGFTSCDRYMFTTEAITACRVRRITMTRSAPRTDEDANLRERLRLEYVDMQEDLLQLLHKSADERVASFLLTTGRQLRQKLANGDKFVLMMPRGDIADHLGLSVETVCRALSRLRRDDTIALEGYSIVVVRNFERLRNHAGAPAFERPE